MPTASSNQVANAGQALNFLGHCYRVSAQRTVEVVDGIENIYNKI